MTREIFKWIKKHEENLRAGWKDFIISHRTGIRFETYVLLEWNKKRL